MMILITKFGRKECYQLLYKNQENFLNLNTFQENQTKILNENFDDKSLKENEVFTGNESTINEINPIKPISLNLPNEVIINGIVNFNFIKSLTYAF